jgi:glycosyltransferase involved in cell wall biosynthesis
MIETKNILINVTAAKTSGALSVLKDCVSYLETNTLHDSSYHLFTVVDDFDTLKNIQVHKLKRQNWLSRIIWDNGGLQKWCHQNNIEPDAIVSLQNTSTKYRTKAGLMVVQVVYYHQTIPLYQWNGLMEYGFKMWLYHQFYPFFVNRNNKITHYVVQLPYIKELFLRKFTNISFDRVTVIRPNDPRININKLPKIEFDKDGMLFKFLYPATPLKYKNHAVLVDALAELKQKNPDIAKEVVIFFTVTSLPDYLMKTIIRYELDSCIHFIGQVSYQKLLSYYKSVDALLFPSKMESFGLPLAEATYFGLPIIAADLPYTREVLEDYTNKIFVDPDNVDNWTESIRNYKKYIKMNCDTVNIHENSWETFFKLIDKLILEHSNASIHQ